MTTTSLTWSILGALLETVLETGHPSTRHSLRRMVFPETPAAEVLRDGITLQPASPGPHPSLIGPLSEHGGSSLVKSRNSENSCTRTSSEEHEARTVREPPAAMLRRCKVLMPSFRRKPRVAEGVKAPISLFSGIAHAQLAERDASAESNEEGESNQFPAFLRTSFLRIAER